LTVTKKETSRVPESAPQEKTPSGLTAAILELAGALRRKGILDDATFERIMMRHGLPQIPRRSFEGEP
jgi:hypothetical protein